MKTWIMRGIAPAALVTVLAPVHAATVVVETTLDLTTPQTTSGPGFQGWLTGFSPGFSVDVAEGDTFDLTIDFLGTQTLTVQNAMAFWAFSYANFITDVDATGTLSLLDAGGNALLTSQVLNDVEGIFHLGQYFTDSEFAGGLPATLTFYGVRYVGTVNDYTFPTVTVRTYDTPGFYFIADDIEIGGIAGIPEPASWALMIGGFALAGAAMRRRKIGLRFH